MDGGSTGSTPEPVDRAGPGVDGSAVEPGGWVLSAGGTSAGAGASAVGPDRATLRLALVVGGLVLAVLLGFGLGRANGRPTDRTAATATPPPVTTPTRRAPGAHEHDGTAGQPGGDAATGLSVTSGGYTLTPSGGEFVAGRRG